MTRSALAAKVQPTKPGATVQLVTRHCRTCGRTETVRQIVTPGWKPADSHVCGTCVDPLTAEETPHTG